MAKRREIRPHHQTGHAYPTQARADVVPHADAPASDLLTHSQLQEEERDADDDEEDEVRNQISTCEKRETFLDDLKESFHVYEQNQTEDRVSKWCVQKQADILCWLKHLNNCILAKLSK